MKPLVLMLLIAMAAMPAPSQTPAQKPKFEVARIKANTSGDNRISVEAGKGRFAATNVSLRTLVRYAFDPDLPEDGVRRAAALFNGTSSIQVIGGPNWIGTERFDIDAKPSPDHPVAQREMQLMMQSLMEDRFQLKVHREMREVPELAKGPVDVLVIDSVSKPSEN
jgi:uncharacterized protein (TIGR03435 family)